MFASLTAEAKHIVQIWEADMRVPPVPPPELGKRAVLLEASRNSSSPAPLPLPGASFACTGWLIIKQTRNSELSVPFTNTNYFTQDKSGRGRGLNTEEENERYTERAELTGSPFLEPFQAPHFPRSRITSSLSPLILLPLLQPQTPIEI